MRHLTSTFGLALAAFLVLSAAFTPDVATAQGATTRPIFLALPDDFPNVDARVVLLREHAREVVVLDPASATPDELSIGLRLLARVRHERPEPTNGEMIPILGFVPPKLSAGEREWLEAALAELRARPIANVGNLGTGRWMRLDPR